MTAPDREAAGLVRAGKRALWEAGEPCIGLLSPHATATPYNDAAEAKAIGELCPEQPVVHPFKAQIGHTLGAAGALELCAAADAMRRNIAPAAAGEGVLEENLAFRLLDTAEADDSVRVVLLTNAGNTFCAGADLKGKSEHKPRHSLVDVMAAIIDCPKPVIGRIAGHCTGGGVGLAAACDISIVEDSALFGFTEVRLGVCPAVISVVCLPKLRRATEQNQWVDSTLVRGRSRLELIAA